LKNLVLSVYWTNVWPATRRALHNGIGNLAVCC
jgi:hypothetical protein